MSCVEPATLSGFYPAPSLQAAHPRLNGPGFGRWPFCLRSVTGEQSIIVILVKFPGLENHSTTAQIRENVFTKMNNYLTEVSYGFVHLTGNITAGWLRLNRTNEYYGSGNFTEEKHSELIEDSFAAVHSLDLSRYSRAIIVHAGDDEASTKRPNDIWSFSYIDSLDFETAHGRVTISVSCVAESDPLGVWLHELGHQFGLPELYDTTGAVEFVGPWCLMAEGVWNDRGNSPAELMAWCRIKLGWLPEPNICVVNPGDMITAWVQWIETRSSQTQTLKVVFSSQEYYLIESRARVSYDSALPESGVIISYVNETKESGRGIVVVQDADPSTPSLRDVAYKPGQSFVDRKNGVEITVVSLSETGFQVKVQYRVADLVVTGIAISSLEPRVGSTITFSIEIVNQGTADTHGFIVSVSVDDDLLLWEIGSLGPGASKVVTVSWKATQGSHLVKTQVDPTNTVEETNEENNVLIKHFKAGYLLTIQTPFSNISVTLDGEQHYTDGNGTARIVVEPGTRNLSIQFIVPGEEGSRSVFDHWSDSQAMSTRVLPIDADMTLEAAFKQQYELRAESLFGNVVGAGWSDVGQLANLSVLSPLDLGNGTRRAFSGWTGEVVSELQTIQVLMNSSKKVKANWKTQHQVQLRLTDHGGNDIATAPDKVVLHLTGGGEQIISHQKTVFLEQGSWSVQQVIWESTDVTPKAALGFELDSPTEWVIPCRLFSLEVEAMDVLGRPVPGALILISLVNGSRVGGETDQAGRFGVAVVPQGKFNGSVSFWGQIQRITGAKDKDTIIRSTFILSPTTFLITVAAATACVLALPLKQRRTDSRLQHH